MTSLRKASFLAILSAMILCAALTACNRSESITVPRGTFEKLIGQGSPDTNFISRMEFVAARLAKEELQNSNNWASMRTILVQIEQKFAGLEKQAAGISTSMVQTNHPVIPSPAAPVIPPLTSAPVLPPVEKGKP